MTTTGYKAIWLMALGLLSSTVTVSQLRLLLFAVAAWETAITLELLSPPSFAVALLPPDRSKLFLVS